MRKTFLGYFLFFSLFLCCFYACVQDENSGSSKIDRFFNTSDADKYLQGVVSSLKQKNDSSDFATEFIKTYGYPLWSNAVAFLEGKCYTYAVPVKSLLPNSEINAIWFFVMNDSCTNYHVYSRKMADAITRQVGDERQQTWMFDYFTYYALHKKPASGLKFEEMPVTRTKSTVEEKTCVGFAYSDGTTFEFGIYCWDSGNGSGSGSDDGSSGDTYSEPDYPDPGSGSVDDTRPPVDPSNGGSGGNGSANSSNDPDNSNDPDSPCGKAQILSKDMAFRQKVNELFNAVQNYRTGDLEDGWIKTTTGEYIYPSERETDGASYAPESLTGKKIVEEYHNHPEGTCFPSYADLRTLAKRYRNGQIDMEDFSYGVVSSMGCFSLVISSEDAFKVFAERVWNNELSGDYNKILGIDNIKGVDTAVAKFIDFLKKTVSGLDVLFNQTTYDSEGSARLTDWEAKNSDGSANISEYDCN